MRIRKGQSVLRVRGVWRIESAWLEDKFGTSFALVMVDQESLARIKATWENLKAKMPERPLYVTIHQQGVEIFPPAERARKVHVQYATLHSI